MNLNTPKTKPPDEVASSDMVRLLAPLRGQYCSFEAGEIVKVRASPRHGTLTVERAKWRNSLTISNILAFVPDHLVCIESNDKIQCKIPLV